MRKLDQALDYADDATDDEDEVGSRHKEVIRDIALAIFWAAETGHVEALETILEKKQIH